MAHCLTFCCISDRCRNLGPVRLHGIDYSPLFLNRRNFPIQNPLPGTPTSDIAVIAFNTLHVLFFINALYGPSRTEVPILVRTIPKVPSPKRFIRECFFHVAYLRSRIWLSLPPLSEVNLFTIDFDLFWLVHSLNLPQVPYSGAEFPFTCLFSVSAYVL